MDASTRAAVASALTTGKAIGSIYDVGAGRHVTLSGRVTDSTVSA